MGRNITVYLTNEELKELERICLSLDSKCPNVSRAVKESLKNFATNLGAKTLSTKDGKLLIHDIFEKRAILKKET